MAIDRTYTPPDIIANTDDTYIHARMLEHLPAGIDKTAGGFAHDFTYPAAFEKSEMLVAINEVIKIFFPAWSYSGFLDLIAERSGLTRRSATAASGDLTIEGEQGTTIPQGFLFSTPATAISSNVEFEVTEEVTLGGGETLVHVRCTQTGLVGNVPPGSIILMSSPMSGISAITNKSQFTGGTEIENDDSLRQRIEELDKSGEVSFTGCDADYVRWAKEVDGIGTATTVPEWDGPGTVKVIVTDSNGQPANDDLIAAVYDHIMAESTRQTDRLAPIGATLTVDTCREVSLAVVASVYLEKGADLDAVTAAFTGGIKAYFEEAKTEKFVRYTRIGSILSETAGVLDYANMTLNGTHANIPLGADEYPVIQSITLTEAK